MKRSEDRARFLADVITMAVEGGTGYWAQVSQYQWTDEGAVRVVVGEKVGDEPRAVLHPLNDDESGYVAEGLVLTVDAVASGVAKVIEGKVNVHASYVERIRLASRENDAGDIDADDADVIAQAALLGEVVYG